jgi:hypothetical protein
MRSLPLRHVAAAAILLAIPTGLTACGSGKSGNVDSSAPASASSSAPATQAGPSDATGKPSKQEVAAGMTQYLVGKGVPRSLVDNVANCIANKGYSQFSDSTLRALQSGKISELNPLDAGKLTKVTTTCLASGAVGSSLPSVG